MIIKLNFVGKLLIFMAVLPIFWIGQSAELPNVELHRTFQRRHLLGGGNIDGSVSIGGNAGIEGNAEVLGRDGRLFGLLGKGGSLGGGSGSGGMLGGMFDSPIGDGGVDVKVNGQTNSFSEIVSVPLQFLNTASGAISGVADGVLGTLSSPITLSNSFLELSGLEYSPILGPVSGSLLAGVEAIGNSPGTLQTSLSGGLQDFVDGITGTLASPVTISNDILGDGIQGVLSSPLTFISVLSANLGDLGSGVLRPVSSPLTISAQALDVGVDLTVNSAGGALLPDSLDLALPGSISRGIEALIDSPKTLKKIFIDGLDLTEDGLLGLLVSPLQLSSAIIGGQLTLHTDSPLIFPGESNNPYFNILAGFLVSFLYSLHALLAQLGITLSGILTTISSLLMASSDFIDVTLNTNVSSPNILPDESDFGFPNSVTQGIDALGKSPMALSSTIADSAHYFFNGVPGIFTSPITVLCSYSPFTFPGSEHVGPGGILDSPMDLSDALSNNIGYTLAGLLGFLSSPVTLSAELLRASVNWNVNSLNMLPEQLALWGIPDSIGSTIASFFEVPFEGLLNILGFISSPLVLLDGIGIANVPGSPNSPPIFPPDFPEELPDENLPPYVHKQACAQALSGGGACSY